MNFDRRSGLAESTTAVPCGKTALHVPGQSIPAGAELTRPCPVPPATTATLYKGTVEKPASTCVSAAIRTEQLAPVHAPLKPAQLKPPQAPPNPVKFQPESDVASSRTAVPSGKSAAQVRGQSIPAGSLRTAPAPNSEI